MWYVFYTFNLNRDMIIKFFKYLMARKKRNEKFKKDFFKKTGVDLNQIDPGGHAKPRK